MSEDQETINNREEETLDDGLFEDEDALSCIPLEEKPLPEKSASDRKPSSEKPEYGLGVTAMILGILCLLLFCIPVLGLVLAAFAVVLGIVSAARRNGRKMGISGIIMGGIGLVSYLIVILLFGGMFQLMEQNRDNLTDSAWRWTTDGSVLYLYQDGTFIDVEKEGVFTDNFYSGTYDILSYEEAGVSFDSLESQYDTEYAYDVCLYVDLYVSGGEERETIANTIHYLYFFDRNYGPGDVVNVCAHDSTQYGAAYPVKATDMDYPSIGNQYVPAGEITDSSESTEAQIQATTATAASGEPQTTEGEYHFWGELEEWIDTSKKTAEEISSSVSEEWEKNSGAVSSAADEVNSAVQEAASSAADMVSSMVEETGSTEEAADTTEEETAGQPEENGIRKALRNLVRWLQDLFAGWGF